MHRHTRAVQFVVLVGLAAAAVAVAPSARANNTYLTAWRSKYAGTTLDTRMATLTGSSCNVCHHPTTRTVPGNCYRQDIAARLHAGRTIQQALDDVDGMDSDGDGVANGVEIMMARPDGAVGYSPGLRGATGVDPCGTNPTAAVTNQAETPPPPPCRPDFNVSGGLDAQDIFDYLAAWFAGVPSADYNGVDGANAQDIFDFLAAWFVGC